MVKKKRASKKTRTTTACKEMRVCVDCGKTRPARDFENDPDICWECWQNYHLCKKCNEYFRDTELIPIMDSDEYICEECAERENYEE